MTMEIVGNDAQFNGKVTLLKDLEIYGDIKNKTKDTSFDFSDNLSFKIQGDEKLNIGNDNTIFKSDNTIFKSKGIERLQITSGGNVLVGGSGVSQTNRELVIGSNSEADLAIETHNTSPSETANIRFYRSRGTAASPLPLIDNDVMSQLIFYAFDGNDYANTGAVLRVECDGTIGINSTPAAISFYTNSGTVSPTERLRISSQGNINISNDLNVSGNISAAGTITYDDVTNIDSIGIITARSGIVATGIVTATSFSGVGAFVSGMIILWSGAADAIPSGFVLCDGNNSTPNLTDRFIVGAGSGYAVNATGGSADATLPSHYHNYPGDDQLGTANGVAGWNNLSDGSFSYDAVSNLSGGGTMWRTSTKGSSATNANLPPYYALCYIMKT